MPSCLVKQKSLKITAGTKTKKMKTIMEVVRGISCATILRSRVSGSLQATSSAQATGNSFFSFFPPEPPLLMTRRFVLVCCCRVGRQKLHSPPGMGTAAKYYMPKAPSVETAGRVEVIRTAESDILTERLCYHLFHAYFLSRAEQMLRFIYKLISILRAYEGATSGTAVELVYFPHSKPVREDGRLRPFSQSRHLEAACTAAGCLGKNTTQLLSSLQNQHKSMRMVFSHKISCLHQLFLPDFQQ